MTTKPQKFRAFQAECCFQRSGLSSQSWSLSTASEDAVTRYSPDKKKKIYSKYYFPDLHNYVNTKEQLFAKFH